MVSIQIPTDHYFNEFSSKDNTVAKVAISPDGTKRLHIESIVRNGQETQDFNIMLANIENNNNHTTLLKLNPNCDKLMQNEHYDRNDALSYLTPKAVYFHYSGNNTKQLMVCTEKCLHFWNLGSSNIQATHRTVMGSEHHWGDYLSTQSDYHEAVFFFEPRRMDLKKYNLNTGTIEDLIILDNEHDSENTFAAREIIMCGEHGIATKSELLCGIGYKITFYSISGNRLTYQCHWTGIFTSMKYSERYDAIFAVDMYFYLNSKLSYQISKMSVVNPQRSSTNSSRYEKMVSAKTYVFHNSTDVFATHPEDQEFLEWPKTNCSSVKLTKTIRQESVFFKCLITVLVSKKLR